MQQKNDKLYIKYIRSRSIYKNLKFNWQTRGVLDFYNYENMEELSSTTLSSYMADAIHPNANGYAWMAGIFETYLRNAYVAKNPGETI